MLSADAAEVARDLGLGAEHDAYLAELDAVGDGPAGDGSGDPPPEPGWVREVLARAAVADDDAAAVLGTLPDLARSPSLRWLLRRGTRLVAERLGDLSARQFLLPQLPPSSGQAGRCFPAHLFAAAVPVTLAWHRARGIPERDSWAIFADLGRQMALYRERYGVPGVEEPWWLLLHLRGLIYEFGRLQYNLVRLGDGWLSPGRWFDGWDPAGRGPGFRAGDDALSVHIPETGPLTPVSCDASLAAARAFFDRYFPSATRRIGICESWLLDGQLALYLPARSNIVEFQRRFTLIPAALPGDKDITQFVLKRAPGDLAGVPQRTTLERAIVAHLRGGGHWRVRSGWLELPASPLATAR